MQKGSFRGNVETLVRLLPRPQKNGKPIVKFQNSWLIVEEYGQSGGIVVLNKTTNHEGQIPYDSIREWREPDMVILRAQVNMGKNGCFELNPFTDGPETEMLVEGEEFLPERVRFVKDRLKNLTDSEVKLLTQLVIQVKMRPNEIREVCSSIGISDDPRIFFNGLIYKTGMIEKDSPHSPTFTAWIMDTFVQILERELLPSPANKEKVVHPPSPPSTQESDTF